MAAQELMLIESAPTPQASTTPKMSIDGDLDAVKAHGAKLTRAFAAYHAEGGKFDRITLAPLSSHDSMHTYVAELNNVAVIASGEIAPITVAAYAINTTELARLYPQIANGEYDALIDDIKGGVSTPGRISHTLSELSGQTEQRMLREHPLTLFGDDSADGGHKHDGAFWSPDLGKAGMVYLSRDKESDSHILTIVTKETHLDAELQKFITAKNIATYKSLGDTMEYDWYIMATRRNVKRLLAIALLSIGVKFDAQLDTLGVKQPERPKDITPLSVAALLMHPLMCEPHFRAQTDYAMKLANMELLMFEGAVSSIDPWNTEIIPRLVTKGVDLIKLGAIALPLGDRDTTLVPTRFETKAAYQRH